MWNILAPIIGSAVGKVLGKVAEWVPSKAEARRNSLIAYKKERDGLLKQKQDDKNTARMSYLNQRIGMLEKAAIST